MANLFGEKIKQLRTENNLLQKQVASPLGIDPPMRSKVDRDERRVKR